MNNRYNTAKSEGHTSSVRILKDVQLDQRFVDTIPGHWDLVPMEKDQFSQKLDRAGFSSRQNDPTLKGVK